MRKQIREKKINSPKVIFEDESVMVINKPAGWVVNDAKTAKNNPILQNWLKENKTYEISKSVEFRSGIVHRLDKETSGVMIVAKNEHAFRSLQKQFKNREVKKKYVALVHGSLKEKSGDIDVEIGRLPWRKDRFGVLSGGRNSFTSYKVKDEYQNDENEKFSYVEFYPKTGRTHQIRVHAKHIGHPIVSDSFYAGRKTSRNDKKWCPRLFLHASSISFTHPEKGERVSYSVELSGDLKQALSSLHVL